MSSFVTGLLKGFAGSIENGRKEAERRQQLELQKKQIKLQENQYKLDDEIKRLNLENTRRQLEWAAKTRPLELQLQQQKIQAEQKKQDWFNSFMGAGGGGWPNNVESMVQDGVKVVNPNFQMNQPITDPSKLAPYQMNGAKPPPGITPQQLINQGYQLETPAPTQTNVQDITANMSSLNNVSQMKNMLDEGMAGPIVGPLKSIAGKYGFDTKESLFDAKASELRIDLQSALKGTPSDKDQELIDKTTPSSEYSSNYNRKLLDQAEQKIKLGLELKIGAYKGTNQPIPPALLMKARQYGINVMQIQPNNGDYSNQEILEGKKSKAKGEWNGETYSIGQEIKINGKTYIVNGFYPDGEPNVSEK